MNSKSMKRAKNRSRQAIRPDGQAAVIPNRKSHRSNRRENEGRQDFRIGLIPLLGFLVVLVVVVVLRPRSWIWSGLELADRC
jgi:hypothetical protein